MRQSSYCCAILVAMLGSLSNTTGVGAEPGLVGHWKLQGDCQDYSGLGNHGENHGVDLSRGAFDGAGAYVEVPPSDSLQIGSGDFAICAWLHTEKQLDDIVGDVIDMYDPGLRRGITLSINSSAGGYQSQGTDRHIHFGIDNAHSTDWQDCGRPNPASNYVSNSLTVFKGKLYAATSDAKDEADWCHVYRYEGDQKWADCGRVGNGKTTGVGPLIVHNGDLYAATTTYDWNRVNAGDYEPGRVYRYRGGTQWEDCGQPSDNRTLTSMASYNGKLYVSGGSKSQGVFVRGDNGEWTPSKIFSKGGPQQCFPHTMCRHNGKLFVAFPGAHAFDGEQWTFAGHPYPFLEETRPALQTHSLTIHQGKLCAGTWPEAIVSTYEGGERWQAIGRVGVDGTEVNSLVVYNGKLYGGSLPRAEVCRYDGRPEWTSLKKFSPEGWEPESVYGATRKGVNEWCRATSLTVYNGKLFVSTGSCTSSVLDAPLDVRGKVFRMEAGTVASYDDDLGPGWKHIAAVRGGGLLKLYIDGKLVATSSSFDPAEYDLSTDEPLRIGFGQTDYFAGKMADVRLYTTALTDDEVKRFQTNKPEYE